MQLHEHQAKTLLREHAIPVPPGRVAGSGAEAAAAGEALGGPWVVKAQVHAGGRGKAGGVRRADSARGLCEAAQALLGQRLVTAQTDARGLPVNAVLVESATELARELYLGMLVDRGAERVTVMASDAGGVDIETVAAAEPARIHTALVDPVVGLQPYQGRQLGFALGLTGDQVGAFVTLLTGAYRAFEQHDLALLEINPLGITAAGELLAVDAKVSVDDAALYRQARLAAWEDPTQADETEVAARDHGLNYITLDGDIACMVNGAGLAMATMDLIKLHGGEPANFLDVGGGATAERVAEAFKLILADPKVRAILVNIFGGIVRCDLIAEGIVQAVRETAVRVPVVVRLEGTNAEAGRALLEQGGVRLIAAADLTEAAERVVAAASANPRT
ncbi:MAG: ADP-forming succinate--CoA ligase subunit beta [Gammaproteobacteria bacterium]|nr:ADP-forming succinate--CoA ligase subunit beta [Gammaproteobacteria bacterium]